MWKVYLFEFIVVVIASITWVNILDKSKDQEDEQDN